MLVTMKALLIGAEKEKKAVGAFSVGNMEMVMGVLRAAEKTRTPVILQIAEKRLKNSPLELMGPMMVSAAKNANVDVAVHLDHGLTLDCVQTALGMGFTSVMLDGSLLPYEENVAVTKEVVRLAALTGATVEAELGGVALVAADHAELRFHGGAGKRGNEGDTAEHKITCTDPDTAADFCSRTGIDALAVAIGNAHGNYPVLPALRFDVLEEIDRKTDIPLVLHGGTGMTDEMFRRAISLGIRKINIATAGFDAYVRAEKACLEKSPAADWFTLSAAAVTGVCENTMRHIKIFNME